MSPELHPAYRFSGIARPVDPEFATNKALLVLMGLAGAAAGAWALVSGQALADAAKVAAFAVGLVFVAWAMTRELSPDDNAAAFVAVGLAAIAWFVVGPPSLLLGFVALMGARLVNRSTGLAATWADTFAVGLGFAAATWWLSWTCGVAGCLALGLDGSLATTGEPRRRHLAVALGLAALTTIAALLGPAEFGLVEAPDWMHLTWAAAALISVVAIALHPTPSSGCDVGGRALLKTRVRGGLAVGLSLAVALVFDAQMNPADPNLVWAGLVATSIGIPRLRN